MRLKRFTALGAMALAVECAAQPAPCSLEELARLGGAFACVSSNGEIAIVSVANRLLVMDVSDPTDPVEVGRLEGLEGVRGHRMAGTPPAVLNKPPATWSPAVTSPSPGAVPPEK